MLSRTGGHKLLAGGVRSLLPLVAVGCATIMICSGCGKVSSSPIESVDVDRIFINVKIELAASSVAPGGELKIVILATEKGGGPAKDGTLITLTSDALGEVIPTLAPTLNGQVNATFKAGTLEGPSTIKASSTSGASHSVTVQIAPAPPTGGDSGLDQIPSSSITWAEANISDWKTTATITSLSVDTSKGRVYLTTTPKDWPQLAHPSGPGGMGNWWMIAKVNDVWHAATFEWLGVGRTQAVFPEQFNPNVPNPKRLRGGLSHWVPKEGETVGFCQSTFARDHVRTTNERTDIKTVVWPKW